MKFELQAADIPKAVHMGRHLPYRLIMHAVAALGADKPHHRSTYVIAGLE